MSSAKITTVGFYQYMNAYNNDLFGLLNLPPGIDKDTLVNNIMLRGGEFEVVYSNPDFYKSAIGLWSNKHYRTFEKWINALSIDYNPLENYDRMEEWTDDEKETSFQREFAEGEDLKILKNKILKNLQSQTRLMRTSKTIPSLAPVLKIDPIGSFF